MVLRNITQVLNITDKVMEAWNFNPLMPVGNKKVTHT